MAKDPGSFGSVMKLPDVPIGMFAKDDGTWGAPTGTGVPGADGRSAYQVALDNGFVGTESQWLASLVGPQGPTGSTGPQGPQGSTGADGPQGQTGAQGPQGPSGADSTVPGPQGPAGADGAGFFSGAIVMILSGTCPAGWAEESSLNGKFVLGTLNANGDIAGTGGADSVTPSGTVSQPTASGAAVADHSYTPAGTNSGGAVSAHSGTAVANHVFTQPTIAWPAGVPTAANESAHTHGGPTISWPAGVPTASGTVIADHAAHTHSVTSNVAVADHASHTHTYTDVVNHVHVQSVNSGTTGALSGYTPDTSTSTSTSSGYSTANPTGGVATGTTAGPSATLTHAVTNNAVTSGNPSATLTHSVTTQPIIAWPAGVPTNGATGAGSAHTHTISWPAGVPTASGGAVDAHAVTQPANHTFTQPTFAGTPATLTHSVTQPTISQPTFAGNSQENRPAFVRVIFCRKT